MYDQIILYLLFFYCGAAFGSFLYCISGQWVSHSFQWNARSTCDHCERTLQWYELLPLISFVTLQAKCYSCAAPLSSMYVITELVVGNLFGLMSCLMLGRVSLSTYCYYCIVFFVLVCMSFCDLHSRWVPDTLQLCLLLVVLFNQFDLIRSEKFYLVYWLGFICLMVLLYTFAQNWIGGADIKLLAILSVALDLLLFPYLLLFASCSGLIYIAFVSYVLNKPVKAIPFIPFISFSFYIVGILMAVT